MSLPTRPTESAESTLEIHATLQRPDQDANANKLKNTMYSPSVGGGDGASLGRLCVKELERLSLRMNFT